MNLPPGAYISVEGWIVYGDQAYLPQEWAVSRPTSPRYVAPDTGLTQREREVIELLAEGKAATVVEVSRRLGVAVQTLKNELMAARRRTGCHSTMEMVAKFSRGDL